MVAEVRYPPFQEWVPETHNRALQAIRRELGSEWVLHQEPVPSEDAVPQHASFIISRDRTWAVTVDQDRLALQTTDYQYFEQFHTEVLKSAKALEQSLSPDGITRIGLRYIDEISLPEESPDWSHWLSDWLIPKSPSNQHPSTWTGIVRYDIEHERHIELRYGPQPGPVVKSDGLLQVTRPYPGPIFVLDFDSFWKPKRIPLFNQESVKEQTSKLQKPVKDLFQNLITENLREYFRKVYP